MNDLQWLGLFMIISGLSAAFAFCWWFEMREKSTKTWHFYSMPSTAGNFKWYIIEMRSKLYGIDFRSTNFEYSLTEIRRSTMLEF